MNAWNGGISPAHRSVSPLAAALITPENERAPEDVKSAPAGASAPARVTAAATGRNGQLRGWETDPRRPAGGRDRPWRRSLPLTAARASPRAAFPTQAPRPAGGRPPGSDPEPARRRNPRSRCEASAQG